MKMKWLLILLLVVILSIIAVQNNTALEWQAYDGDPVGIYAGGFVIVQDALYSIGGSSDKGQQKGNHQYDPATKNGLKKHP